MTPERLDGIRRHIAEVGRCSACWTNIPDLLAHVDALTAESERLRAAGQEMAEAIDLWWPEGSVSPREALAPQLVDALARWLRLAASSTGTAADGGEEG